VYNDLGVKDHSIGLVFCQMVNKIGPGCSNSSMEQLFPSNALLIGVEHLEGFRVAGVLIINWILGVYGVDPLPYELSHMWVNSMGCMEFLYCCLHLLVSQLLSMLGAF